MKRNMQKPKSSVSKITPEREAAMAQRVETALKVRLTLGYAIVAIAVVLGFVMGNVAVGIGLAVLAILRLLLLRREVVRERNSG